MPALAWLLLVAAAFAAGLATGVLSDGTAEVLHDFQRSCARSSGIAAEGADRPAPAIVADPSPAPRTPPPTHPSGTIEWATSVAPGTELTDVTVRDAGGDPVRVRFAALARGQAAAPVATVWLDPSSHATISLPTGWYRVGSTRIRRNVDWDPDAGDETYLTRPLHVEPVDPDEATPSLSVGRDGNVSASHATLASERPKRRPRPARTAPRTDYEGLGAGAHDGGAPTYAPGPA